MTDYTRLGRLRRVLNLAAIFEQPGFPAIDEKYKISLPKPENLCYGFDQLKNVING